MIVKRTAGTLLAVIIICSAGIGEDTGKGHRSSEQMHFSAEEAGVEKPVPIPEAVLAMLKTDDMVRNALANEEIPPEKIPLSWFSAATIHLNGPEQTGLVVMAAGSLRGSNATTFWVFRGTASNYALILTAPAHDLEVKKTRWKGYRDIELTSLTAVQISTVVCRFNGKRYTKYRAKTHPIQ